MGHTEPQCLYKGAIYPLFFYHESWAGISAKEGYNTVPVWQMEGTCQKEKGLNQESELDTDGSEMDFSAKEGL